MNHFPPAPHDYSILAHIGTGAFSKVYKCIHKPSKKICAIKIIPKEKANKLNNEIDLHQKLHHPSIIKLFEYHESSGYIYIVTELCDNGTLASLLQKNLKIDEKTAKSYFIQIAQGLQYLHETEKIVHRDIKPENIMLDQNGNAKIIDFGLSTEFTESDPYLTVPCGSPKYVAPEVFNGSPYKANIDIWALGINLYYWMSGHFPFDDIKLERLAFKVQNVEPKFPSFFSESLVDLLKKMLNKNPDERITWDEIFVHPWVLEQKIGHADQVLTSRNRRTAARRNTLYDFSSVYDESAIQKPINNENHSKNILESFKQRTQSSTLSQNANLDSPKMSIIDKLCATGQFKRKERQEGDRKERYSKIVQSILTAYDAEFGPNHS